MLVALAGGVGAARLLNGLVRVMDPADITAIVNTGDDLVLHGLHISPDIDTVTYTLAGLNNRETGWGVVGETWTTMTALAKLGGESWFSLGDQDLATHLYRTQRLSEGATLSETTAELAKTRGVGVRILPMSDDPVHTRVALAESAQSSSQRGLEREVSFQDYFVRLGHGVPVRALRFEGADDSSPAPGVIEAITQAEVIVCCPSNPLVSIGPILAVPGIKEALTHKRHSTVAVSPIVAGAALRGPADRMLIELGHQASVVGVARLYSDWVSALVIDQADAQLAPQVEAEGVRCLVAQTVMSSEDRAVELAKVVRHALG